MNASDIRDVNLILNIPSENVTSYATWDCFITIKRDIKIRYMDYFKRMVIMVIYSYTYASYIDQSRTFCLMKKNLFEENNQLPTFNKHCII